MFNNNFSDPFNSNSIFNSQFPDPFKSSPFQSDFKQQPQNQIRLEIKYGKERFEIFPDLTQGIFGIKEQIFKYTQIPPQNQKLIYKGQQLKDDENIEKYRLQEGGTIMLLEIKHHPHFNQHPHHNEHPHHNQHPNHSNQKPQFQRPQQPNQFNNQQNHQQQQFQQDPYQQQQQQQQPPKPEFTQPSFLQNLAPDSIVPQFTQFQIQELLQVFDLDKNKGLKHISDHFKRLLTENLTEQQQINEMQELELLLEELGQSKSITNINGILILLNLAQYNPIFKVQKIALGILGSISQNNKSVQQPAIDEGALVTIMHLIQTTNEPKLVDQGISTLGKLIRGEYLRGKQMFIELNGIEFLLNVLDSNENLNLKQRIYFTLRDIIKTEDPTKGQAKQQLIKYNFLEEQLEFIQQVDVDQKEIKISYYQIAQILLKFNPIQALKNPKSFSHHLQHIIKTISQVQDSQDEIALIQETLSLIK